MQLKEIDEELYRKHLRVVFGGIAVALMLLAVIMSTFVYLPV